MSARRTGFVVLAHARLDRAGALVRHLRAHGAPVVVHLDRRCTERGDFADAAVLSLHAAEWGTMALVDATLDAAARLLADHPATAHVALVSGDTLPVRPLDELDAFLEEHPGMDFIESVPVAERDWVAGGLSEERLTLWHPISWRRWRRGFDALVALQRAAGVRRRLPPGLAAHFGSQWWCLSARTLRAMLEDPRLPAWRRFFRLTWIPDESFFQTVVRSVGEPARLRPHSLMLARFDAGGQPHAFHDDHADWLAGAGPFLARKADPDAEGLYARFLGAPRVPNLRPAFGGSIDEAPFAAARRARLAEPAGLQTQARFPSGSSVKLVTTARSWGLVAARDPALVAAALAAVSGTAPGVEAHGRLFAPEGAVFAGGGSHGPGNLPADPRLRDHRPEQFLARLIFARRERFTLFGFVPGDTPRAAQMAVRDHNARIVLLEEPGEALLPVLRGRPPAPLHARVVRLDAGALRAEPDGGPTTRALIAAFTSGAPSP